MLDENLPSKSVRLCTYTTSLTNPPPPPPPPAFFLKSSNSRSKDLWTVYFCQHGNEPDPVYALRYPDPSSRSSKNRYAVALYDPYVPDVVYGEVLIIPEWTQPTLSADVIRQNGGATPPPEPILPTQFTVRLYNPDQHITVRYKHKTWNSPASWEFEMPQHTFRQPSASSLDHALTDPSTADVTPKLKFSWRKDSKLSKDLTCLLSGKTTTVPEGKTKSKEPDITVSIFRALKELTLYEPNLYRVEMEDFKGLEVVLLLGAVAIRDVYFSSMKDAFHISHEPVKPNAQTAAVGNKPGRSEQKPVVASGALSTAGHLGAPPRPHIVIPQREPRPPQQAERPQPQGEVDAEKARRRKQKGVPAQEDSKRTQKLLEAEDRARRKKQEEIDMETRRLQKIYGREEQQVRTQSPAENKPRPPPRPNAVPNFPPRPGAHRYYYHHQAPSAPPRPGPSLQVPGQDGRQRPQSSVGSYGHGQPAQANQLHPKKSSFFGFRKSSAEDGKLSKKRSSMF